MGGVERRHSSSSEAGVSLAVPGADVGLDVRLLDAGAGAEVSLGLPHGGASEQERVRTYYNYILVRIDCDKQRRRGRVRGRSVPEGDFRTSSSMVMQEPPALVILARALSVKRRAATSSLGRSRTLESSVTVPTTTAVLELNREGGGQTRLNNQSIEE